MSKNPTPLEAAEVIKDMIPIINPDEDYMTIVAANEQIALTTERKKKALEEVNVKLKAITKALEAARISSTRPPSAPSPADHATLMKSHEKKKQALLKSISDQEVLNTRKEADLAALKEEVRALEDGDVAEEFKVELDGTEMRMQVIRGLGFEPESDENGVPLKMLIRAHSGDVHLVELDDETDTDHLWKLNSS